MIDLVCVGSSHLHAIRAAVEDRARAGSLPFSFRGFQLLDDRYQPEFRVLDGKHVFNAAFDDDFCHQLEQSSPPLIFTYLGGAEHVILALVRNARPFDIIDPSDPDGRSDPEAEIIPFDVMFSTCCERINFMPLWFHHLRELADLPLCQIGLPPPITGDEHIISRAGPGFREQLAQYGVAPARLRQKVWRLCLAATRHVCQQHGVDLIEPPQDAIDADGCLKVQYRGYDEVHANRAYGDLLLDRMLHVAARYQVVT